MGRQEEENARVFSRLESGPGRARSSLKKTPEQVQDSASPVYMLQSVCAHLQSSCAFRR